MAGMAGQEPSGSRNILCMKTFLGLIILFATTQVVSAADLYRWQDATGQVRYSDQMPPPSAKNVTKYKVGKAGLINEKKAAAAQPPEVETPVTKDPVILFSFVECGDACKTAEDYLNQRGIPYTLKNQENDKTELKALTGELVVPVLLVGKEKFKGFETGGWDKLLTAAGYPPQNPSGKSAVPAAPNTPSPPASQSPAPTTENPAGK